MTQPSIKTPEIPGAGPAKITELESLRGLAALLIVFTHVPLWNPAFNFTIARNGYLMVELFFVLSGFVIFNAYSTKINTKTDLLRFQFLRLARLYPVHFLFFIVFVAIELMKYVAQSKLGISSPNSQPFVENNLTALLQQVFLLQAIGPTGNAATFNGPAWSISVEFYTYLLFGLVVLFCGRFKHYIFAALFLTTLLLKLNQTTFGFYDLLDCFTGFFLGCMVADAKDKLNLRLPSYVSMLAFSALVLVLMLKAPDTNDYLIFPLAAALIFTVASSETGPLKKFLQLKVLTWLGTISYSMYMCHITVTWVVNQIFRVYLKRPQVMVDGRNTPSLSIVETVLGYILLIGTVLVLSHLVYKFVEKPLRERSRKVRFGRLGATTAIEPVSPMSAQGRVGASKSG